MKRYLQTLFVGMVAVGGAIRVDAQGPTAASFGVGSIYVGVTTMAASLGSNASLPIGGELEYGISEWSGGAVGIGFSAHYFSRTGGGGGYSYTQRELPMLASVDYHVLVPGSRLDPFGGVAIGYVSGSFSDNFGNQGSVDSGAFYAVNVGARFALTRSFAVLGSAWLGSRNDVGRVHLGVVFQP